MLNAYEKVHSSWARQKALDMCLDHIRFEDRYTKWICIGPVIYRLATPLLVLWLKRSLLLSRSCSPI